MNWIEVVFFFATVGVLFYFTAYALATLGICFAKVESGNIKFVVNGDSLSKVIHDVKGMKLDKHGKFVPGEEKKSFINERFGLWWIGFPPFARIHSFPITKERENPDAETPKEWINRDPGEKVVSSLRFIFPRPYMLKEVELGDRIPVDLLVVAKFEVVDPYIPVFLFKGKFFENAGADIRAKVSDILKGTPEKGKPGDQNYVPGVPLTLDAFVAAEKGETDGILKVMKDPYGEFNRTLVEQVGIRLVGISIPKYDPSDKDVRAAMNAEEIAKEEKKAVIVKAEAYSADVNIRTEADAGRIKTLAQARGEQIRQTVTSMASTLAPPALVAESVTTILEMEAATSPTSKLTTFVKGGAPAVVPVGQNKSTEKKEE